MKLTITNISGKFVAPQKTSFYAAQQPEDNVDNEVYDFPEPKIPECPRYTPTTMEKIRHYFGSLWWLWIVVAILYFSNNE